MTDAVLKLVERDVEGFIKDVKTHGRNDS